MKKNIFAYGLLLLTLLSACGSNGGGDDEIIDVNPIYFVIGVVNDKGEDVLDSTAANYNRQFVDNTTVTYREKTYPMNYRMKNTRAFYAPFAGINIVKNLNGKYFAAIGPILRDRNYDNEKIMIHWGDKSEDVITFTSHYGGRFEFKDIKYLYNNTDFTTDSPTAPITITK